MKKSGDEIVEGPPKRGRGRPKGSKTKNKKPQPPVTSLNTGKSTRVSKQKLHDEAVKRAAESGELPHEWLLRIVRGEPFSQMVEQKVFHASGPNKGKLKRIDWVETQYYPSFGERVDAAKSCAPFFAPKLVAQTMKTDGDPSAPLAEALNEIAKRLPV